MERPRRSEYTPNDLSAFDEAGTLEITPKFQRRTVWRTPQRSYFVDSLLRGMPVPPIFLRETHSEDFKKTIRQVIDGQQRVRSVLEFMNGQFPLSSNLDADWAGKRFERLSDEQQERIRNYHFAAEVFVGISDAEILEIFARMNTHAVPLNRQELRNGRYFGEFKQSCYALALEHLEFWRRHRLFTETGIARMSEVELTSELLIQGMDGMQDKKASIDTFYSDNDERFAKRSVHERRFRAVLDTVDQAFPQSLEDTDFRRPPFFYTLYGAIYHRLYGLPKYAPAGTPGALSRDDLVSLATAATKLTDLVRAGRAAEPVPEKYSAFVTACLQQTDNIQPRRTRLTTLLREWRAAAA